MKLLKLILFIFFCFPYLAPLSVRGDWSPNGAVALNGNTAYLTCASTSCRTSLSPTTDITIDAWLYIDGFTSSHDFAGVISMPGSYQLVLRASGTGANALPYLQLDYYSGGISHQLQVPVTLPQRTWYQVSLQFTKFSSSEP